MDIERQGRASYARDPARSEHNRIDPRDLVLLENNAYDEGNFAAPSSGAGNRFVAIPMLGKGHRPIDLH